MTSPLFRQEAVDHATRRLCGDVVLATPLRVKWLAVFLIGVIALALTFAVSATYARKESVVGWLTPESGMVRATARRGGAAIDILVDEGSEVSVGAKLAVLRLSPEIDAGDSGPALLRALLAQSEAARIRARTTLSSLDREEQRLIGERAALDRELSVLLQQIGFQEQRVEMQIAETRRGEQMVERGAVARIDIDRRRGLELAARQDLSALRRSQGALNRDIQAIVSRLGMIPLDRTAAEAEAASAHAALDERATQTRAASEYVVTSPINGRVAAVPIQLGQTLEAGGAVAVITPSDGRLMAELYVPSRAAGFVREAQEVRLMYEAFPYQRFGVGAAEIEAISQTVLAPNEVAIPGMEMQEPVFRARAALARETVDAYGERLSLQPGMLLRADVIIDRRSLLEWLFDPILAVSKS
ncbi:MAG: HlyD family efflux transporter periplasmic adaptor subunit [Geminicoccaceae bacterium]